MPYVEEKLQAVHALLCQATSFEATTVAVQAFSAFLDQFYRGHERVQSTEQCPEWVLTLLLSHPRPKLRVYATTTATLFAQAHHAVPWTVSLAALRDPCAAVALAGFGLLAALMQTHLETDDRRVVPLKAALLDAVLVLTRPEQHDDPLLRQHAVSLVTAPLAVQFWRLDKLPGCFKRVFLAVATAATDPDRRVRETAFDHLPVPNSSLDTRTSHSLVLQCISKVELDRKQQPGQKRKLASTSSLWDVEPVVKEEAEDHVLIDAHANDSRCTTVYRSFYKRWYGCVVTGTEDEQPGVRVKALHGYLRLVQGLDQHHADLSAGVLLAPFFASLTDPDMRVRSAAVGHLLTLTERLHPAASALQPRQYDLILMLLSSKCSLSSPQLRADMKYSLADLLRITGFGHRSFDRVRADVLAALGPVTPDFLQHLAKAVAVSETKRLQQRK